MNDYHKRRFKREGLEGEYREWYSNGQISIECTYCDGKREGKLTSWYSNGQISIECTYCDGKREGEYREWYENGQISIECTYCDGKREGKLTRWYSNGNLSYMACYRNDMLHGMETELNDDGSILYNSWWICGIKVSQSEYNAIASLVSKVEFKVLVARQFGLSLPRFKRCIRSLKSRIFCEWWYSPDGIGGRRNKKLLGAWLSNNKLQN